MTLQLHTLEGFYRVALAEGYARAARSFPYPITQPAVHQQVRKLEGELGVPLFERVAKDRVVLTRAGRVLFDFCEPFFRGLPDVVRRVTHEAKRGVLRLEAGALEVRHVVPAWLERVAARHPEIAIDVREADDASLSRVSNGEVDLVVDHFEHIPKHLRAIPCGTHYAFFAWPKAWGRARSLREGIELSQGRPFVAFPATTLHGKLQRRALVELGLSPERMLSSSTTESILSLAGAGLGFSIVPWPSHRGPVAAGLQVLRFEHPEARFSISAVARSGALDPLVEAALAELPGTRRAGAARKRQR